MGRIIFVLIGHIALNMMLSRIEVKKGKIFGRSHFPQKYTIFKLQFQIFWSSEKRNLLSLWSVLSCINDFLSIVLMCE